MQAPAGQSERRQKHLSRTFIFFFIVLVALRESHAQAQNDVPEGLTAVTHSRKIVVSIPHRKLALIEDGKVSKIYPVAVGTATVAKSKRKLRSENPAGEADLLPSWKSDSRALPILWAHAGSV